MKFGVQLQARKKRLDRVKKMVEDKMMRKCSIYNCKKREIIILKIDLIIPPGWSRKHLANEVLCKHHAKELQIKTEKNIYYETYDQYKTEFEAGHDITYSHCGEILTIECIEPKYFNEMMKDDENNISFEELFSYAGLNCAFCFHLDWQHKNGKGECKDCELFCERYRRYTPNTIVNFDSPNRLDDLR
jgi:hypothetical protein